VPAFKYTMIFTYFSGLTATQNVPIRLGGWTESYYAPTNDASRDASFNALIQARLGMCPRGTVVNKFRVQQVDPAGPSQPYKVAYSAPNTWLSDVPQMALKIPFFLGAGLSSILREFRGVPDVQVTTGEYSPSAPYTVAVQAFLAALVGPGWQARQRVKSNPKYAVNSIAAGGIVTMIQPFTAIAPGAAVQIIRTVNPMTGRKFGYFATVTAVTDDSHFTIAGPKVAVSNYGTMRIAATTYTAFSQPQLSVAQAVVRKVGRPSRSYSGRASKHQ